MEQRTKVDGFILTYITKISSAIVICMSFITRHHDYKLSRGNKTFHKKTRAATKGVLKNLQNSQENICARVSFLIKLQAPPATLLKNEALAQMFTRKFREIS